jgi:hypothetical protein
MDVRRVASLLREIADAIEQEAPKRKSRKRVAAPDVEPTKEAKEAATRALRKAGFAA